MRKTPEWATQKGPRVNPKNEVDQLSVIDQITHTTMLAQLLLMHVATGNALALGLAAAHLNEHAVSLQGHANAHAWPLAHVASARQVSMASAHLSKLHVHWSGQAAVVQSTSAAAERVLAQLLLMHVATGNALALGLAAAHFNE